MTPWWVLAIAIFGVNLALWGVIGMLRVLDSSAWRKTRSASARARLILEQRDRNRSDVKRFLTEDDVAVLIPAHNEESVIADSLRAITALVPLANVHVASDGSHDRTVEIARAAGVHVLETASNIGKAGALQESIRRFSLVDRFELVMLLDADTRVEPGYFAAALPLFREPDVVAVAGCVRASWRGRALSPIGRLVSFHRQRIYSITQYLLKFGQTWRCANATHIVPGFASVYRCAVLPEIEVNPPGLVIEDFNMTFEVYQKGLGKVGFTPSAVASTEDPGTLRDYIKQSKRWSLGLWQTVRRHPPKANLFSVMLAFLLVELLASSMMLLLLPGIVFMLVVPEFVGALASLPMIGELHSAVAAFVSPSVLLFGVILPDLAVTGVVALFHRQPRFLVFGWFFLLMRILDAAVSLYALSVAWSPTSTGRWNSPQRHVVVTSEETGNAAAE